MYAYVCIHIYIYRLLVDYEKGKGVYTRFRLDQLII